MILRPDVLPLILAFHRAKARADRIAAIRHLGEAHDPAAIPHLVPSLFTERDEANAAATAIDALLADATDEQLLTLDADVRREAVSVHAVTTSAREQVIAKIASFDASGFVREAAVRNLASNDDGNELPFLLIRLNDWVPQVRAAARTAVEARITPSYAAAFLKHFALVERLMIVSRVKHQDLVAGIARLLATASMRTAIIGKLRSGTPRERRLLFRLIAAHSSAEDLMSFAADFGDPVLQSTAVRHLPKVLPNTELLDKLNALARSPFAMVRREAVLLLASRFPRESSSILHDAVMDRSATIRNAARFARSKEGIGEFASRYREELHASTTANRIAVALTGIAETGSESDAAIAAAYFDHSSARVRRAAVAAVGRLNPQKYVRELLRQLDDSSPAVSAAARNALRPCASDVGLSSLWILYEFASVAHVRRNACELFGALSKWDSLCALLRMVGDASSNLTDWAIDRLRRWNRHYNRTATVPSRAQCDAARTALDHATRLDPHLSSEIRFCLDAFAR